jgi:hypothetical protein
MRISSKVGVPCGWPSTLMRSVIFVSYGSLDEFANGEFSRRPSQDAC